MKFRKAKKKDISEMFEILKSNNPKYSKKLALRELKEMFSNSLIKPKYIVAEDNGKIVAFNGYSYSWTDNLITNLFWLNVHPNYMRKGIGSKLVIYLISHIKKEKLGVKMIILSTKIPSFFKRFGFKIIERKYDKNYNLMAKRIN
ncbi:MAG: GNAT family N-acetyltransferase [archaeon]